MGQPAFRVEGLGKRYRLAQGQLQGRYRTLREAIVDAIKRPLRKRTEVEEFWALKDVSFEVQTGQVVGIIGRNGAGKSTLLKILSRITKPTTGSVEIIGRVGSLLEVGTGFHPELTGRENVYLNGSILGMSKREIQRKFDAIVAFAEVEKFLDTPVKRYSSGMYVRLAFAVASHLEPEILIIDEVLAVGDAGFQQKCLERIREAASGGRTVLLVSHQLNSVRDLCSQAVWMDQGGIRNSGQAGTVIKEYLAQTTRTNRSEEWIELSTAPRSGSGEARFHRLQYSGSAQNEPVYSDGEMRICVEINVHVPANDYRIGLWITDRFGTRLVGVNTFQVGKPLSLGVGLSCIEFTLLNLHLYPGTYCVSLAMGSTADLADTISDAFTFEVEFDPRAGGSEVIPVYGPVTRQFHYSVVPVVTQTSLTEGL